jgi:hypothetical protein
VPSQAWSESQVSGGQADRKDAGRVSGEPWQQRGEHGDRNEAQAPRGPEVRAEHGLDHRRPQSVADPATGCDRSLDHDSGAGRDGERREAPHESPAQAPCEGRASRGPARPTTPGRAERGEPSPEHEEHPAEDQSGPEVRDEARARECDLQGRARALLVKELGDADLGRPTRVADGEGEAAGDGVRVTGDHAIRGGVDAVVEPGFDSDADGLGVPLGADQLAVVDPGALAVVHAHGAEVGLYRLVEAE